MPAVMFSLWTHSMQVCNQQGNCVAPAMEGQQELLADP